MALTKIHFENLLAFKCLDMAPIAGINVLLGKNGTGKTQILKTIYALADTMEGPAIEILLECFKQGMKRNQLFTDVNHGTIVIDVKDDRLPSREIISKVSERSEESNENDGQERLIKVSIFDSAIQAVYIPVKDMLTHANGLLPMATKYRDFPFDRTLTDIISRANRWKLKQAPDLAVNILPRLEGIMNGKIVIENDEFYVQKKDGRLINFAFEAEGIKKIGLLWQLLMNESITKGSILLWDEPEANLNPEYLPILVECLLELSRHGVQIFVSTHNYLFAKYFDVRRKDRDDVAYHALYQDEEDMVCYEKAERFDELKHNAIMDAYNKLLDEVYGLQVGE